MRNFREVKVDIVCWDGNVYENVTFYKYDGMTADYTYQQLDDLGIHGATAIIEHE